MSSMVVGSSMQLWLLRSSSTNINHRYFHRIRSWCTSSAVSGIIDASQGYEQPQQFRTMTTVISKPDQRSIIPTTKSQPQTPLLLQSPYSSSLSIDTIKSSPGLFLNQQYRTMTAAKAANKPAKKDNNNTSKNSDTTTMGYWDQKKATKDRRREIFISRQERKQRVKVRRAGKPKDAKKIEFQAFYIQKKVTDEFLDRKARQAKLDWQVRVAVLLERLHVVLPDKEPWEVEYEILKTQLNRYGKQYPKEFVGADFDYDQKRPMTDEELLAQLPFTPAPRVTEDDVSGNVRTTNRKLKDKIFLSVQEQDANGLWQFPTVNVQDNETLLTAAKRAIPEQIGTDIHIWCPSNCPWSVQLTPYSDEEQKQHQLYGTKTFFMKVQYDEGDVEVQKTSNATLHDFAWLDRQELVDRIREQQGDEISKLYYYML